MPQPGEVEVAAQAFAHAAGLSVTVGAYLYARGFRDVEATHRFLDPRLSELTPPHQMVDRDAAAERLADAIRGRQKICVFGDYDCDGITSAAILSEILRELGGEVTSLLASRFDGGYGVSAAAAERIAATTPALLVTCDCGSSDHTRLADLRARGVETIVIDHHLVPDEPLPAVAFLNPHRPDCGFSYKGLASCGLVLSVGAALRAVLGKQLDLRRWLDLVAIGTIADVAPLDGDNRALVRAGLAALRAARRPGIRALLDQCAFDATTPITSHDVAYRLAPRLNAPGRLGEPRLALDLLTARSDEDARACAAEIEQLSLQRRALQDRMIAEAVEEIEQSGYAERAAIVIGREGWSHGIVGIVAGRLAARYARPTVVVGFEGAIGRGSVRGPEGARLYDALSTVAAVLTRYGGHQAAAGLEVELDKLVELREGFERACASLVSAVPETIDAEPLAYMFAGDEPARIIADFARLEPFGLKNPLPKIAALAEVVAAREVRGGHLKLELEFGGGRRFAGFAPEQGQRAEAIRGTVQVFGRLRPDRWRGGDAVEMLVERIV